VNELAVLDDAARGMSAQRTMLDLAARNVAAAQAAVPGHPYQRLVGDEPALPDDDDGEGDDAAPLLTVTTRPGTGDPLTELIAVLDAQRAYEANASIFDVGKRLAERTLDIDR
jgi:flagellar basal body rod protein FlgC